LSSLYVPLWFVFVVLRTFSSTPIHVVFLPMLFWLQFSFNDCCYYIAGVHIGYFEGYVYVCIKGSYRFEGSRNVHAPTYGLYFDVHTALCAHSKSTPISFPTIFPIFMEQNYFLLPLKKHSTINFLNFLYIN